MTTSVHDRTDVATPPAEAPSGPSDKFVVGVIDAHWLVEQISATGSDVVENAPTLGASLFDSVHVGDRSALVEARARAIEEQVSVAADVHIGTSGQWHPVRLVVAPMVDQANRVGFVLSAPEAGGRSVEADRLQKHLDRIGRELEAAGIDIHRGRGVDLDLLPTASELSPRQWEVLHRLLRGERVPGIARDLFISTSTVRNHLTAVFAVVGVHSQEELLTLFRRPAAPVRVAS